ncbi:MAG: hypothetical protein IM561_09100 [Microcystis sp. M60BS1]|nr:MULTISPECIES: hypothetical protein [unclassified Microcystis]MCA2594403.1 hypothetical protein [Microcystis sp. M38BS1]MCA2638406.1 hypothetical protein [Microcystis sp. M18BS1]MCA6581472.1 hypothetical protein [Pseudanabaena sp. M34BS1SP1A06MG]MCA2510526.1 hypothetical protein [Microcystis sp. M60BS1]MCA2555760.1 hypothetical protein [Microcystis sp. M43BS1]
MQEDASLPAADTANKETETVEDVSDNVTQDQTKPKVIFDLPVVVLTDNLQLYKNYMNSVAPEDVIWCIKYAKKIKASAEKLLEEAENRRSQLIARLQADLQEETEEIDVV